MVRTVSFTWVLTLQKLLKSCSPTNRTAACCIFQDPDQNNRNGNTGVLLEALFSCLRSYIHMSLHSCIVWDASLALPSQKTEHVYPPAAAGLRQSRSYPQASCGLCQNSHISSGMDARVGPAGSDNLNGFAQKLCQCFILIPVQW